MKRRRHFKWLAGVPMMVATGFYLPVIGDMIDSYGLLVMMPLFVFVFAGGLMIWEWLDDYFSPKARAREELHNAHVPRPTVRAADWESCLNATPETVEEAFKCAKDGQYHVLGVVDANTRELVARWDLAGWQIEIIDHPKSRWALARQSVSDDEARHPKKWLSRRKSKPLLRFDDETTAQLVTHFLGWNEPPPGVEWDVHGSND